MKETQFYVALDDYEHGTVIDSLNEKRKDLKSEGKTTDAVDGLTVKIGYAPQKKFKVIERERRHNEAR